MTFDKPYTHIQECTHCRKVYNSFFKNCKQSNDVLLTLSCARCVYLSSLDPTSGTSVMQFELPPLGLLTPTQTF